VGKHRLQLLGLLTCLTLLPSAAAADECVPAVHLFNSQLVRPLNLPMPNGRTLLIKRKETVDASSPDLQVEVRDSTTHAVLLSGSLQRLTGDKGARDFAYVGYANLCFPDFQGAVLAFQAGATGLNDLFIVFRSSSTGMEISNIIKAWAGGIVLDHRAQTFTLYDMIDDPEDQKDPMLSCNFCPKRYSLTSFALKGSKLARRLRAESKKRLSPQDFVDHPLRYR